MQRQSQDPRVRSLGQAIAGLRTRLANLTRVGDTTQATAVLAELEALPCADQPAASRRRDGPSLPVPRCGPSPEPMWPAAQWQRRGVATASPARIRQSAVAAAGAI